MKTIFTLTATLLIAFSLNANAGDKSPDLTKDKSKSMVAVAPFVWGNPDEAVPEDLRYVRARFAKVPVAPFVWGKPDESAPESLRSNIDANVDVPVAPFVWGNAEETAPELHEVRE